MRRPLKARPSSGAARKPFGGNRDVPLPKMDFRRIPRIVVESADLNTQERFSSEAPDIRYFPITGLPDNLPSPPIESPHILAEAVAAVEAFEFSEVDSVEAVPANRIVAAAFDSKFFADFSASKFFEREDVVEIVVAPLREIAVADVAASAAVEAVAVAAVDIVSLEAVEAVLQFRPHFARAIDSRL